MTTAPVESGNPYVNMNHLRVLYCTTCGTLDELTDFEGPPQYDDVLEYAVSRHGTSHIGSLFRIPIPFWIQDEYKRKIIEQIRGANGKEGLAVVDPEFYNTRNMFKEDADRCYLQHLQPSGACPDWMNDSKRLHSNVTKAERKEAGLSPTELGPRVYLCSFCPVSAFYRGKINNG